MSKKILIIDDETDLLMVVQARLEANGFIVITSIDGEKGLEKAKKEKPDLIILDLIMPKINGEEVCKRLKKCPETKNIPIIALTASGHPDSEKKIRKCGASDFMHKPFEDDDLLLKIKRALGDKNAG